ncbi:Piwi-domain-containing protein [Hypoxylon sp. NC1633]|nr:Piwi-domain-containing protein [Hypoxylon sp. NC1633]
MSGRPSHSGTPGASQLGSRAGSHRGSQVGSQAGSPTRGAAKTSAFQKGGGYDPARDRVPLTPAEMVGKRVDLPVDAYKTEKDETRWAPRPGFVSDGKAITVGLNLFAVTNWSEREIYQYDITVIPNVKQSNALVKKVWNTQTVTELLRTKGGMWLYDGSKLAWSSEKIERGETRITVDLDQLKEKAMKEHELVAKKVARQSVYSLTIRQTTTVRLSYLKAYLQGKIAWDSHVLECMNFFDHCIRQNPSEKWITIKRNFYDPSFPVASLSGDLVVNQGIYCAPRLSETINRGGTGLAINVDRCQTAFWPVENLAELAGRIVNSQRDEWQGWDDAQIAAYLKPRPYLRSESKEPVYIESEPFKYLKRMERLKFTVSHVGKLGQPKIYSIKRVLSGNKYGKEGATSKNVKFEKTNPDGTTEEISVYDHYVKRWGVRLGKPSLPIIESARGGYFPMELCTTIAHQKYNYKLNPQQTTDMIRHAATRPGKRQADIMEGVQHLKWREDAYLKAFGIDVENQMIKTSARLLQNPEVSFGNTKVNPGTTGRWDLRGKTFYQPNQVPLKAWSFICCGDDGRTCKMNDLENFARQFSQVYRTHGGKVAAPAFVKMLSVAINNFDKVCEQAFYETGNHFKAAPQLIFFILPTKNQLVYERIKKNMDCQFNIVSQCLQGGHVKKCQAQYMSNVAMKVNAKLGGVTCRIAHPSLAKSSSPPFWSLPTMMIGVDVSHGGAGSQQPSMAALTMSLDKFATRFAGACQTNGLRQEVVTANTMHMLLPRLAKFWVEENRTMPKHIYYLRDGCSEGQFKDVLGTEVAEMRRIFRECGCGEPKFTVIIATKRHHVRFFPKQGDKNAGDRNGNPLPGTLVERDVTHPQHFDFYLCSHAAIQGTARPVHYQVILDEAGVKPNDLTKMIYQQCYQYCRSTTPVSLHPAVYYSHLASNRARSHESFDDPDQKIFGYGKAGFPYAKANEDIYGKGPRQEIKPLLPMVNSRWHPDIVKFMNTTMWYV